MNLSGVIGMALEGLRRKKGRAALTALGIFVSVLALTLIISLGEGLTGAIGQTLTSDENLRLVLIMPGYGEQTRHDPDSIIIEGEMSERRRERLKRAAMARGEMRVMAGRRTTTITDDTLRRIAAIEHVTAVRPLVFERYAVACEGHSTASTLTFGLDVELKRFSDRVVGGRFFSAPDAAEVIIHEYLLYQWGLKSEAEQESFLGRKLILKPADGAQSPADRLPPGVVQALNEIEWTAEERRALGTILPKILGRLGGATGEGASREFTIVGILRENEPGDPVSWGEVSVSDVFLPDGVARAMFAASGLNAQMGYQRAMVHVDEPANVPAVEDVLKRAGFTAYSVAGFVRQAQQALGIITVILSFLTGVALIVATLGIVNTMVTSVLERTRDIGIWKAVGATDLQVQAIFLVESALIGLLGGGLGLAVAALGMWPGNHLGRRLIVEQTTLPFSGNVFHLPLWLALAGPALGMAVAVLAAIYPARRAARVDPVRALRHD